MRATRSTGTNDREIYRVSSTVSSWRAKGCNSVRRDANFASEWTRSDENKNPGNRRGFSMNQDTSVERTRLDSNQRPSVSKTDALDQETPRNVGVSDHPQVSGSSIESTSAPDRDLDALLEAWSTLPAAIKAGIVAMVKASAR